MDEQQVKDLIQVALLEYGQSILEQVDKKNAGTSAALSRELKKLTEQQPKAEPEAEPTEAKLTLRSLEQRIQELTSQLEQEKQQAFVADRNAAISGLIGAAPVVNRSLLQKVFMAEYADKLQKENDAWFLTSGDKVTPLDQVLQSYLSSDEGKAFLPASEGQGAGSVESTRSVYPSTQPASLEAQYADLASRLKTIKPSA